MDKIRHTTCFFLAIAMSLTLSGCQLFDGYSQTNSVETPTNWVSQIIPVVNEVNITCAGMYHCEIIRIDQTQVISPKTHEPVNKDVVVVMPDPDKTPLLDIKSLKLVPLLGLSPSGLTNYYARVKPIKREIQVNFYPEDNLDYVERFTIIHEFVAGIYQVQAYRMQADEDANSLLENASPMPLCVDLIQDGNVERRFCKQASFERQSEFIETGVFDDIEAVGLEEIFESEDSI